MTIDWFTFLAQILNFLVLTWLLKRFLYRPIVDAMDQREARIADRLHEADAAQQAAQDSHHDYQAQMEALTSSREELLADANRDVEVWRAKHLAEAKADVEKARGEWQRSLAQEQRTLLRELQLEVAHHATDVSRHLLQELANDQLHSLLAARFLKRLSNTDADTKQQLRTAHRERALQIETSHQLSDDDRSRIALAVRQITASDKDVEFHSNPELICGIELLATGCKLAWSIRESLAELESRFIEAIDQVMPEAKQPATSNPASRAGRGATA